MSQGFKLKIFLQAYADLGTFVGTWPILPAEPNCLLQLQTLGESTAILQDPSWTPDFQQLLYVLGLR